MLKNTEKSKRLAKFIEGVKDAEETAQHLKEWARIQSNQITKELTKYKSKQKEERHKQAKEAEGYASYVLDFLPIYLNKTLRDYEQSNNRRDLIASRALFVLDLLDVMAGHMLTLQAWQEDKTRPKS